MGEEVGSGEVDNITIVYGVIELGVVVVDVVVVVRLLVLEKKVKLKSSMIHH